MKAEQQAPCILKRNKMEFLLNIASSAYFAIGASVVIIVCIVLIIIPIMNRIKNLDEIVKNKLNLLPTSSTYGKIIDQIIEERKIEESSLKELYKIKDDIDILKNELSSLNKDDFETKMGSICELRSQKFITELADLEKSLSKFSRYIRDNEARSEIQLNNLVAARIDTTDVLIELLHDMKDSKVISDKIDIRKLYDVKRNLQQGFDSIQRSTRFKVLESNAKSGNFNRFIDEDY